MVRFGEALAVLLALAVGIAAGTGTGRADVASEREAAIASLLETYRSTEGLEDRARLASVLGELRASEAAPLLVAELVRLHRRSQSPLRDPDSPDRPVAQTLVEALRSIGRPGLEPFLEALATWDGFALDLTWAFVSVHGEEGILMLRQRARSEPNRERRARLEAAVFFTRLRSPEVVDPDAPQRPAGDQ